MPRDGANTLVHQARGFTVYTDISQILFDVAYLRDVVGIEIIRILNILLNVDRVVFIVRPDVVECVISHNEADKRAAIRTLIVFGATFLVKYRTRNYDFFTTLADHF